jgi:hypothetical protein
LGKLGQGVPLVWSCSTWSFQWSWSLVQGLHTLDITKDCYKQALTSTSSCWLVKGSTCSYALCICSHFFKSSWSINLATSPWNLKLSGKQCCFSTPFFPVGHSLLIPGRHLTIVSSGCIGALWHWHALITTQSFLFGYLVC